MAPRHEQFESKSSSALRRRLSSDSKQKPHVIATFAGLAVSSLLLAALQIF
jgi:hypothetical protein